MLSLSTSVVAAVAAARDVAAQCFVVLLFAVWCSIMQYPDVYPCNICCKAVWIYCLWLYIIVLIIVDHDVGAVITKYYLLLTKDEPLYRTYYLLPTTYYLLPDVYYY